MHLEGTLNGTSIIHPEGVYSDIKRPEKKMTKRRLFAISVLLLVISQPSLADGRFDVFARSATNPPLLLHKYYDNGWGPSGMAEALEVVGTGLAGDPAAVSWGPGRLDVFARGPNGELLHEYSDNGGWSPNGMAGPLEVVGTGLAGDPAVVSWGKGRLDVFARSSNGELLHKYFDNGGWGSSGLEVVGTGLAGDPAVVSWGPGRLDVFARGPNGELLHKYFDNGGWGSSGLEVVGSGIGGRVNAVAGASMVTVAAGNPRLYEDHSCVSPVEFCQKFKFLNGNTNRVNVGSPYPCGVCFSLHF
jgi:hypothetical protein